MRSLALFSAVAMMSLAVTALAQSSAPASRPASAVRVDHSAFDAVLAATVQNERVRYQEVKTKHLGALTSYLDAMAKVDHRALEKDERFAFYLNVYNATVIQKVAERLTPSYRVSDQDYGIFKELVVRLNDGATSLDIVEKNLAWNAFRDPRMHVGFVCGARSCPPILTKAYTAANVNALLDENMKKFVSGADGRNLFPATGPVRLSQLFNWYAADFGGADKVLAYIAKYRSPSPVGRAVEFLDYDWSLNSAP